MKNITFNILKLNIQYTINTKQRFSKLEDKTEHYQEWSTEKQKNEKYK